MYIYMTMFGKSCVGLCTKLYTCRYMRETLQNYHYSKRNHYLSSPNLILGSMTFLELIGPVITYCK